MRLTVLPDCAAPSRGRRLMYFFFTHSGCFGIDTPDPPITGRERCNRRFQTKHLTIRRMKKIYLILLLLAGICFSANAQVFTVSGVVRSSYDGATLPFAGVFVKGTTIGTVTNINGEYRISCEPDAILVFSSLGSLSREVAVKGRCTIDVVLDPDESWYYYPDSDPPGGGFLSMLPGADLRRAYMTTSIH